MAWPFLAWLFAARLPYSLAWRTSKPSLPGGGLFVYIRLFFAYSQDWQASQAASHASMPGRFQSVVRLDRPAIEKKYWKEVLCSPSYFAASRGGAPIQHTKEYIEQQKTRFNFLRRSPVPYIPALKGEVLRHDG